MTDLIQEPQRLIESDLDAGLRHDLELARATRVAYPVDAGLARFEAALGGASTLPSGGTLAGFGVLRWFLVGGGVIALGVSAWLAASTPSQPEQARAPTSAALLADAGVDDEVRPEDEVADAASHSGSGGVSSGAGAPAVQVPAGGARESVAGVQVELGDAVGSASDGGKAEHAEPALPRPISKSPRERPDPQLAALDEAKLIDAARKALADDPAQALELTKEASKRFPSGAMVQERRGYAILALVALDRRDEAETMASEYLERWPKGPLSHRVREALGLLP
jgi:hypothetical protein